jgi:hypothetical protein
VTRNLQFSFEREELQIPRFARDGNKVGFQRAVESRGVLSGGLLYSKSLKRLHSAPDDRLGLGTLLSSR